MSFYYSWLSCLPTIAVGSMPSDSIGRYPFHAAKVLILSLCAKTIRKNLLFPAIFLTYIKQASPISLPKSVRFVESVRQNQIPKNPQFKSTKFHNLNLPIQIH